MIKRNRWFLIAGFGVVILCLLASMGVIALVAPRLGRVVKEPLPTPRCVEPKLAVGTATFTILTLKRPESGSLVVPDDKPGAVYWVEGTIPRYVFALSPTDENMGFGESLKAGYPAVVIWADCEKEVYTVTGSEVGEVDEAKVLDEPASGFTLYIPRSGSKVGMLIHGERPELVATPEPSKVWETPGEATKTPQPETGIKADITFDESRVSPDGKSYQIVVRVKNLGTRMIRIQRNDTSLTSEKGETIAPSKFGPSESIVIAPDEEMTLSITFPLPEGHTALFKILDFGVDLYY